MAPKQFSFQNNRASEPYYLIPRTHETVFWHFFYFLIWEHHLFLPIFNYFNKKHESRVKPSFFVTSIVLLSWQSAFEIWFLIGDFIFLICKRRLLFWWTLWLCAWPTRSVATSLSKFIVTIYILLNFCYFWNIYKM